MFYGGAFDRRMASIGILSASLWVARGRTLKITTAPMC